MAAKQQSDIIVLPFSLSCCATVFLTLVFEVQNLCRQLLILRLVTLNLMFQRSACVLIDLYHVELLLRRSFCLPFRQHRSERIRSGRTQTYLHLHFVQDIPLSNHLFLFLLFCLHLLFETLDLLFCRRDFGSLSNRCCVRLYQETTVCSLQLVALLFHLLLFRFKSFQLLLDSLLRFHDLPGFCLLPTTVGRRMQ